MRNARLRKAPDGEWHIFTIASTRKLGRDCGTVYWPYAISTNASYKYAVTHLPSGYAVLRGLPHPAAKSLVAALRGLGVPSEFTKPRGRDWQRFLDAAKPIVLAYKKRYPQEPQL